MALLSILLLSSGVSIVQSSVLYPRNVINSQRHAITVWDIHFPEMSYQYSTYHEPNASSQNSGQKMKHAFGSGSLPHRKCLENRVHVWDLNGVGLNVTTVQEKNLARRAKGASLVKKKRNFTQSMRQTKDVSSNESKIVIDGH